MSEPIVNTDEFVFVPHAGSRDASARRDQCTTDVDGFGRHERALEDVRILAGVTGARLLDARGEHHWPLARFFRVMQHVGSGENALHIYEEGLKNGGAVMIGPCERDAAAHVVRTAEQNGGRAAAYFGRGTLEVLSQP